eukprot:TRINITY_DN44990_c0_g1_i1.p1 TRINITY_DN44990_c0_g1~~TRINITY_DN44990_c0_g1_i1.p1  ORF type:complete len:529 (+),score=108.30 TRINITY_DN44990_c0_g1_i1:125-1711(+)
MADAALALAGAAFKGHLSPPGMEKCSLSYQFADAPQDVLPPAVKMQRRQLGWSSKEKDIICFPATCSVPALGLKDEQVMISVDSVVRDSSRRMLLQSLTKPDLGITILHITPDGSKIVGGDETWDPGDEPIISALRCEPAEKSAVKAAAKNASTPAKLQPAPPVTPSSGTRSPNRRSPVAAAVGIAEPDAEPVPGANEESLQGFGIVGGSLAEGPDEAVSRMPLVQEGGGRPELFSRAGYDNNSSGRAVPKKKQLSAEDREAEESRSMRPDLATGAPGARERPLGPNALDEEIKAAAQAHLQQLAAAAAAEEVGDMQQLLTRVNPDVVVRRGKFAGLTPLMTAAQQGRLEAVDLLLQKNASLDMRDSDGWTALMHAVHSQRVDVAKALLAAKADVATPGEGPNGKTTPLILAAAGARPEFCQLLLARRAAIEATDSEGCRALHHASKRGNGAAVMVLLEAKAQLEGADKQGRTPLLTAVRAGRADGVRMLLSARADAQAQDLEGHGAKTLATAYDHLRVLKVLADAGA